MARNMNLNVYDDLIDKAARIVDAEMKNDIVFLNIEELHPFKDHPFKVLDNEEMKTLVESISENGVFNPVLVRKIENGYEIISGHRRVRASELAGKEKVPCLIRKFDDNEATIAMVDSNNQREKILPSERAFSLKMKLDALKCQGKRSDLTSFGDRTKSTYDIMKEESNLGKTQINQYIRLTNLIPELMELVDKNSIKINVAYEIAGFSKEIQIIINEYINYGNSIKIEQINKLKETKEIDTLDSEEVLSILSDDVVEKKKDKITFTDKKLDKYFEKGISMKKREDVILKLLKKWKDGEIEL